MSTSPPDTTTEAQPSPPPPPPQRTYQQIEYSTLLGHPHDTSERQATDPFWQQYPDQPNARNFYFELEDIYTTTQLYYPDQVNMSSEQPIVIGHGSRGLKTERPRRSHRPKELVKVWLEQEEIGEISLGVLIRFSKNAKLLFPRAQPEAQKDENTLTNKSSNAAALKSASKEAVLEWSDDVDKSLNTVPGKINTTQDGTPSGCSAKNTSPTTSTIEQSVPKDFYVGVKSYVQPKLALLQYILSWMDANKNSHHGEALLPITPAPLETISDQILLDTYVAVLAYNLTPFPHNLRHEILTRITNEPVQLKQLQYMYDRLPKGDPIINRLVTSILEHAEAGRYLTEEYNDIWNWVESDVDAGGVDDGGQLKVQFARVEKSRKRKAEEAQRGEKREEAVDKLKSGFEAFAGPLKAALPDVETKIDEGRRRNRRQQQANGRAAAASGSRKAATGGKSAAGTSK